MTARPRVYVDRVLGADGPRSIAEASGKVPSPPRIEVEVEFDLHDHERALFALMECVADVQGQIEELS